MPCRVVFTAKQKVVLEQVALAEPQSGEVRVRSMYSLMSTGTENIVFNQLYEPGSHWDRWVKHPFYPGYSLVGEVESVGANVTSLKVGDRVVARAGHGSHQIKPADQLGKIPAGVNPKDAAWFALAKIAAMGAKAAEYKLGDDVLIIGAGPIGQMTLRWARAAGAESITVVDPVSMRLELATRGGATTVISAPIDKATDEVKAAHNGQLPRLVIDTTGNEHVFVSALALAARFGRVVVLGDTGSPTRQHLTSDVITRGVTVIGAHDGLEDGAWNAQRIYRLFFSMVKSGRFDLTGLITHTFAPNDVQKAYEIANTRRGETMGIVFDWTQL